MKTKCVTLAYFVTIIRYLKWHLSTKSQDVLSRTRKRIYLSEKNNQDFLPFNFDFFVTRSKKLIKEGNVFYYMLQVWYIGIQIGNVNIYTYIHKWNIFKRFGNIWVFGWNLKAHRLTNCIISCPTTFLTCLYTIL